jgi:carbamoylphosphate synthase large subunit
MVRRALIVGDGTVNYILPAIRSLGNAGWRVGIGTPSTQTLGRASRWVAHCHDVPRAEEDLDAFAAAVRAAADEEQYDVVFGSDDVDVLALSARREQLGIAVPYAPHNVVLRAVDKISLTEAASLVGLSTPGTSPADRAAIDLGHYPLLVKPRLHWSPGAKVSDRHLPEGICANPHEVEAQIAEIERAGGQAVIQEYVNGSLMAITALIDRHGDLHAVSQQRTTMLSLRRKSARAMTVALDAQLCERVVALLHELRWFGLANLQFLELPDRRPLLIDFNARFYGSLALAVTAGADHVMRGAELAVRATGVDRSSSAACPGVRFQALEEDLRRARVQRRGGFVRDVAGTLRYATGAVHTTWDRHDVAPTAERLRFLATQRLRRRRARPAAEG